MKIRFALFLVCFLPLQSHGVCHPMERDTVWKAVARWTDTRNLELSFCAPASKNIKSTDRYRIEPLYFENDSFVVEFPSLLYLTRRGKKFFERRQSSEATAEQFAVHDILVASGKRKDSVYHYKDTMKIGGGYAGKGEIRFRYWMADCCCEYLVDSSSVQVKMLPLPVEQAVHTPDMIQGKTEQLVEYREEFNVFIKFPWDRSEIYYEYMGNNERLYELHSKAKDILSGKSHYHIRQITIKGYASPEGNYERNLTLSVLRAEAFAAYLVRTYGIKPEIIRTVGAAENWQGLYDAIKKDSMIPYREDVMKLLCPNGLGEIQPCKEKLEKLHKGKAYKYLLRNIYPHLRIIKMSICYVEKKEE